MVFLLGRMLCRQRLRRLQRQYGWPAVLSMAALAILITGRFAHVIGRFPLVVTVSDLEKIAGSLWLTWVAVGVVTGRDLTWHIGADRLIALRIGFVRLYAVELALSLFTVPLAVVLSILSMVAVLGRWSASRWFLAAIGFVAVVYTVRATVSLARVAAFRARVLPLRARVFVYVVIAMIVAVVAAPWLVRLHPARALADLLLQQSTMRALLILLLSVSALLIADFFVTKSVVYSGSSGPASRRGASRRAESLPLGSVWLRLPLLWRVSMAGWLRNRSAVLLLLWGAAYGFAWPFFSRVQGVYDFVPYIWMVMIFHAYLRGNVLGVDGAGLWFYTTLGVTMDRLMRVKNATLTAMQAVMIGAVLLAAALKRHSGVETPLTWACLLSFAVCGLLVGEIAGTIMSIRYPERIDRTSMYSGGFTVGALLVPVLQFILAGGALIVFAVPPTPTNWFLFIAAPVVLAVLRWRALPVWRSALLRRDGEEMLDKIGALAA